MIPRRSVLEAILSFGIMPMDFFRKSPETIIQNKEIHYQPFLLNPDYEEPEQEKLIGLAPKWCAACKSVVKRNHLAPIVKWTDQEVNGVKQYPAVYDPITKLYYYGSSLNSLDSLRQSINESMTKQGFTARHPESSLFGELDKSVLITVREILGKSGLLNRDGKDTFSFGFASLVFNELKTSWSSTQNETTIKFLSKPYLRLKIVDQPISGIVISDTYLRVNIDWFPDINIPAKGMQMPVKNVATRWSYPNKTSKDWLTYTGMGYHLVRDHHQPKDKVDDLTENERFGLHSDLHNNCVQQFILVELNERKWG